jgi:hypothetical protein
MKFINITIYFCILSSVTPVRKIFRAVGSIGFPVGYICRVLFTEDEGIIFAANPDGASYFPKEKGFRKIDSETLTENDDIIRMNEMGFRFEYNNIGLFYFLKKTTVHFDIKIFDKELKVYIFNLSI